MKYYHDNITGLTVAGLIVCYSLFAPTAAWALQAHSSPEGLYVHQMAHVYFFLALGYLYWDVRRSSFSGKGWGYLLKFCIFMLCWNVVAFVGHALAGNIDAHIVAGAGGYLRGRIQGENTFTTVLFYLAKFDHIIVVPALFFLYKGMRTLYQSVEDHAGEIDS